VQITDGQHCSNTSEEVRIDDILIDSRRLISPTKSLFFALKTSRNDGHRYIEELIRKGVQNFVVSDASFCKRFPRAHFIQVKNTHEALQKVAATHRQKFDFPVVGITGSNGKTIVKEWLFQLLQNDYNIVRSPKSYNSQIGVPLSVWQMQKEHNLAIFEAGISEPDEMARLEKIIRPTIGILTNIGSAHDTNFFNAQQKTGEKLNLFKQVETLIYSPDNEVIREVLIRSGLDQKIKLFTWSAKTEADLQITSIEKEKNTTRITGIYKEKTHNITIPFTDDASIENAIHCWATLFHLGYKNQMIAPRIRHLQPIAMRLEMLEGINNCNIINDSYNSDIQSLTIALDFLNQQSRNGQKTLILSDILQSNHPEMNLYRQVADLLESRNVTKLIGIGPGISRQAGLFHMETAFFKSTDAFMQQYPFSSFSNEHILIKGARIFEFERISKALQKKDHETVLEINLNALIQNLNFYRQRLKPTTKIMAMVKAFSYGSGSYEIANALQFHHVDYLSVAYADEGVELRKAGIRTPVMVMNPDEQSFDAILKYHLEPEIYSFRILDRLEEAIKRNLLPSNKPVKIHIKMDTGMHRLGFEPEDIEQLIEQITQNPLIRVQSLFSHLAASDEPEKDGFTRQQIALFETTSHLIRQHFNYPIDRHILNSAGITRFPDKQFEMVRLGISLYGISTDPEMISALENVSTLRSSISQIKTIKAGETIGYGRRHQVTKTMKIATIPIGYADGLLRILSNGVGHIIVNKQKAPIVGNICMDMCMIDITGINAKEGDPVEIFGSHQSVTELSQKAGTIPYEILAGISRRVKRVYFQE
jgi:alanine racemase